MNKFCYCPIGEPQRKFGIYITGAGREVTKPGEAYPHEYHSSDYYFTWESGRTLAEWEYQLLYISDGRGEIEFSRGKPIAIEAGTVILLRPGEWHRYRPDKTTGWSEVYIGLGGDFLDRIAAEPFFETRPTVLKVHPNGKFEHDMLALVEEIQSLISERPYYLAMKTMTLMANLIETTRVKKSRTAHNTEIRRACLFIAHHLGDTIDFPSLAMKIGMGYSLFRRRFAEYTGMAPLEYLLALRLRRAMHLIAHSDAPVSRIAAETGFRSSAYFARFFRKESGVSPMEYRQALRHKANYDE